ncbi:hypothetical protein BKA70DRAFT_1302818, partial [Coprinopsis sp. MPI-PUGE-AT-0042]
SSSSRNLPPIATFAVAPNCDTFFIPTTTLSYCLRLTRIRTFLLPFPFTPDFGIESFGICTLSSCTTSSRGTRLICISLSAQTRQTRIVEGTLPAPPSTILHPSPRMILPSMRITRRNRGKARSVWIDEDMQVVVKGRWWAWYGRGFRRDG